MEMQTQTEENGMGRDKKGQRCICSPPPPPPSVTFSLFRMQILQKGRDRSCLCSCMVPSTVLYTTQPSQRQIQTMPLFSNAIIDFARRAFNEPSHSDMLKFTLLGSKNIWLEKIILITVVIDF